MTMEISPSQPSLDDSEMVVLVNESNRRTGIAPKSAVHHSDTPYTGGSPVTSLIASARHWSLNAQQTSGPFRVSGPTASVATRVRVNEQPRQCNDACNSS